MSQFGKIADKPFSHEGRYGTRLLAKRCDFAGGVTLVVPQNQTRERFASDMMQIAGYHAATILPDLNGFAGYDVVRVVISEDE